MARDARPSDLLRVRLRPCTSRGCRISAQRVCVCVCVCVGGSSVRARTATDAVRDRAESVRDRVDELGPLLLRVLLRLF